MNIPAKNAGIASSKSSHLISENADNIIIPTAINAGAVAAEGTALTKLAKNALIAKQIETTTLVKPVRPPAPIPAALSTYVVVFDVPTIAPIDVAIASQREPCPFLT